ncbi:MAG: single-stranded DNA-binding protein [Pseudomonadota bacterium]
MYIEGRLQTRKWQDKEGKDRYTTEIVGQRQADAGRSWRWRRLPPRRPRTAARAIHPAAPRLRLRRAPPAALPAGISTTNSVLNRSRWPGGRGGSVTMA